MFHERPTGADDPAVRSLFGCGPAALGIVREQFGAEPLDGSLFLFINRRRDRLKILHWDGTGFWVYYKLLEAATFEVIASDDRCLKIDSTQFAMLLGGVSMAKASLVPAAQFTGRLTPKPMPGDLNRDPANPSDRFSLAVADA